MSYSCKILLDSISETGKRITTFEITFPRIVLAEFNTHRMFSRNSASSRTIPFEKQIDRIYNDPFIPEQFPLNCRGMQPQEYITKDHPDYKFMSQEWIIARNGAITQARQLRALNIHKQILNRLLEPFQWHTVIVTATEFSNFFKLRTHPDAQYEIRRIADLMYEAYHYFDNASLLDGKFHMNSEIAEYINKDLIKKEWCAIRPQKLKVGEWHCPLVYKEDELAILHYISLQDTENGEYQRKAQYKSFKSPEIDSLHNGSDEELYNELIEIKKRISVARCARVSYLTHNGKRDIEADLNLFERLRTSGHWSPFEHVATPYFIDRNSMNSQEWAALRSHDDRAVIPTDEGMFNFRRGNFIGWKQFRKEFVDENCTSFKKEEN